MRVVETLIISIIIIDILYIVFQYYFSYIDFETRRHEFLRQKILLLEASDRYIDQNGYNVDLGEMTYLGRKIKISSYPVDRYCIYRIMNVSGSIGQVFFCID
ncbi:MAG: hypothetical protein NZ908_01120 [Candidatus Micrarchaeota archaeon]|nr:hypothetical protein [Candidatus Micrarchaeota archaeon]